MNTEANTKLVKKMAHELGFSACGISKAGFLEDEAKHLEQWLQKGLHGEMNYMTNYFDMRLDPTILVPGAKSVVSLLYNYSPEAPQQYEKSEVKIAKYAWGEDYHKVVKSKLKLFLKQLKEQIGDVGGRAFVDSAPIMERAWAKKSGLGWIGKNAMLLNKQMGSYFFIAELIIDLELQPDVLTSKDYCGTCTACMDACPTDAIIAPQKVDGSKCISYLTIELKNKIPEAFDNKMESWAFGCDICQDGCPWNRFAKPHHEPRFKPNEALLNMTINDWEEITQEVFDQLAQKSPLQRAKLSGMKRNIGFLKKGKNI